MPDRRPDPDLWKWKSVGHDGDRPLFVPEPASPADLLAAVRRGVESGEIEGEVVRWCRVHEAKASARWDECHVASRLRGREEDCSIVVDLRIPVSDGGSET